MIDEVPERRERPADAYGHMAAVLPDWYFTTPPPAEGLLVHVRGRDRCWTQWAMRPGLWQAVEPVLRRRPVATRVKSYGRSVA